MKTETNYLKNVIIPYSVETIYEKIDRPIVQLVRYLPAYSKASILYGLLSHSSHT